MQGLYSTVQESRAASVHAHVLVRGCIGVNLACSKECVDDRVNSRQRKCPTCAQAFSKDDIKQIYL
jgi:hypothetical protein